MSKISLFVASFLSLSVPDRETCHRDCQASESGLQFVSHFEGFSPFIYKDSAGLDTIGIGHLIRPGEKFDEPMLPEDAFKLLKKDMRDAERSVNRSVLVQLIQHQADALLSFAYNLGGGALAQSTLLKKVNARLHGEVPEQFLRWNKVTDPKTRKKVVVKGLTRRRQAEAELYKGAQ